MIRLNRSQIVILTLVLVTILLGWFGRDLGKVMDARWLTKFPSAWVIPFKTYISSAMTWLIEDAAIGPVSFTDITRAIAWLIEQPYNFVLALLANGFVSGLGNDAQVILPAISWIVVITAVIASWVPTCWAPTPLRSSRVWRSP